MALLFAAALEAFLIENMVVAALYGGRDWAILIRMNSVGEGPWELGMLTLVLILDLVALYVVYRNR